MLMEIKKREINKNLQALFNLSIINNIITSFERVNPFHDEPHNFLYTARLRNPRFFSNIKSHPIFAAAGISFQSDSLAAIKCLGESVERFCQLTNRGLKLEYHAYEKIKKNALDPSSFEGDTPVENKKINWVWGINLTQKKKCLIPAQLIFMFPRSKNKDMYTVNQPSITTGAAGGFTPEETLLRAIFEIIERDSFMTFYLNKQRAPLIDLSGIKNRQIQRIIERSKRYNLNIYVLNITNDLEIPTFLTLLVDRTGKGPSVTCGAKTDFDINKAILGSIEEAFLPRPGIRSAMLKYDMKIPKISHDDIISITSRGLFWANPRMLSHLGFALDQNPIPLRLHSSYLSDREALKKIINLLTAKGCEIYYADITLPMFKALGYHVYRVIIPQLQPLYLDERSPVIRMNRLGEVADFFGFKNASINKLPHPFL
jgi:ribosomal protein S12 methylthiotransferase accessory factor